MSMKNMSTRLERLAKAADVDNGQVPDEVLYEHARIWVYSSMDIMANLNQALGRLEKVREIRDKQNENEVIALVQKWKASGYDPRKPPPPLSPKTKKMIDDLKKSIAAGRPRGAGETSE